MKNRLRLMRVVLCLLASWTWAAPSVAAKNAADPHAAHGAAAVAYGQHWDAMTPAATLRALDFPVYGDYERAAHQLMMGDNRRYLNGDTGNTFAVFMTLHHQAAIMTSTGIRKVSRDAELTKLATDIVEAQSREVQEMQRRLASGELKGHGDPVFLRQLRGIMETMMNGMILPASTTTANEASRLYLENMIVHHRGAIEMAQAYLKAGRDAMLRTLCGDVVHTQTQEIARMQAMLERLS